MPFINIKIAKIALDKEKKVEIIKGITETMVRVMDKDPQMVWITFDEVELEDWGIGYQSVEQRLAEKEAAKK